MIRLPDPHQPQAQSMLGAAGGGSTSTTCSSCIVTLVGSGVLAGEVFARAARHQLPLAQSAEPAQSAPSADIADSAQSADHTAAPGSAVQQPARFTPEAARAWGWGVPALLLLSAALMAVGVGRGVMLLTVGGVLALCAHVYGRIQQRPGHGVLVGIGLMAVLAVAAAVEVFLWITMVVE